MGGFVGQGACAQKKRDNKLELILDEALLFPYLSTKESEEYQADWLHRIIKDIVSLVNF